jgi:mRNA interferase MazF
MVTRYVPDTGDLVWLTFDPQSGVEQAGRRPALVLSARTYNSATGLAVICPVTSKSKSYAFEVALPEGDSVSGVILSDHLKSLDWRARKAVFASTAPATVLAEVRARIKALLAV